MNAIQQAFKNAGLNVPNKMQKDQSGWSANLSFKTYQALKNQGIMA